MSSSITRSLFGDGRHQSEKVFEVPGKAVHAVDIQLVPMSDETEHFVQHRSDVDVFVGSLFLKHLIQGEADKPLGSLLLRCADACAADYWRCSHFVLTIEGPLYLGIKTSVNSSNERFFEELEECV